MKLQVTGLPGWLVGSRIRLQCRRPGFDPWVGKIPWRREWLLTAVFLPRESHGQRSRVGYSHWGRKESGTTEQLTLSFSLHQVITLWKHLDDYTSLHHFSQNHFLKVSTILLMMKCKLRTSLMVQQLRIFLTVQGTQVPSLIWDDSTC